jgi:hypothetical protein
VYYCVCVRFGEKIGKSLVSIVAFSGHEGWTHGDSALETRQGFSVSREIGLGSSIVVTRLMNFRGLSP